jgi:hypothetical protein
MAVGTPVHWRQLGSWCLMIEIVEKTIHVSIWFMPNSAILKKSQQSDAASRETILGIFTSHARR